MLANGEHVVRMLAFRDDPREEEPPKKKRYARMRRWWKMMRREPLEASLQGLAGPVYIMEHLENGTLYRLYRNVEHENYRIPNKVLWSFLLCREFRSPRRIRRRRSKLTAWFPMGSTTGLYGHGIPPGEHGGQ